MDDFSTVSKIDTHIHINSETTAFAEQAKEDNFLLLNVSVDVPEYPEVLEQQRHVVGGRGGKTLGPTSRAAQASGAVSGLD